MRSVLPEAGGMLPALEVRLLVDHRERLVGQRTALINDLRWQLHDRPPVIANAGTMIACTTPHAPFSLT